MKVIGTTVYGTEPENSYSFKLINKSAGSS